MVLVFIAWMYVALMMAVAEATNSNGTLLGALVTFVLYGLLPMSVVLYLMGAPARRRSRKAREAEEWRRIQQQTQDSGQPDAGRHASGAAEPGGVAPMGKE